MIGNTITENKVNNSGYYMYNYFCYYSDDLMFKNNTITGTGGPAQTSGAKPARAAGGGEGFRISGAPAPAAR